MRLSPTVLAMFSILALTASACGASVSKAPTPVYGGGNNGQGGETRQAIPNTGSLGTPQLIVTVTMNPKLGAILTDQQGRTLYVFLKDRELPGMTACNNACQQLWLPVMPLRRPKPDTGVSASMLGAQMRADGRVQVTYNDLPLYYYALDKQPGQTNGQGVDTLWYVVSPSGEPVK